MQPMIPTRLCMAYTQDDGVLLFAISATTDFADGLEVDAAKFGYGFCGLSPSRVEIDSDVLASSVTGNEYPCGHVRYRALSRRAGNAGEIVLRPARGQDG